MTASVQFLTGVHTVMECAVGIWPSTLVMVSFHLRKYVECILIVFDISDRDDKFSIIFLFFFNLNYLVVTDAIVSWWMLFFYRRWK